MRSNIISTFERIEKELNALDLRHKEYPIWELVRFNVFKKILDHKIQNNSPFSDKTILINRSVVILINIVKSFWGLIKVGKKDIIIFNHPRRFTLNGVGFDVYTDTFLGDLSQSHCLFENMYQLDHSPNIKTKHLVKLDAINIPSRIVSKIFPTKLSKEILDSIKIIEDKIYSEYGIKIDIRRMVSCELAKFSFLIVVFEYLVKKIKPKLIIEVVGYNNVCKGFNYVAKKYSIPVMELQHGVIGKYHLGYCYPSYAFSKLCCYPDYLAVWGEFWKNNERIPINKNNVVVTGFPYMEIKNKEMPICKQRINILIISQPDISHLVMKEAIVLANKMKNTNSLIYYKLHPNEYISAKDKYKDLYAINNINVIDSNNYTVYDLFKICKVQIGVSSTAIIEGLAYGLSTIIIKLPSWEYYEDFINDDSFTFLDTLDELDIHNDLGKSNSINKQYYWEDNALSNLIRMINTILSQSSK